MTKARLTWTNNAFQNGNVTSNGARVVESELRAYKNRAFSETVLGGAGSTTESSSSAIR